MVVASSAVEELATAENGTVGEIEPQVVVEITLLALPPTRRNLLAVVQLKKIRCVSVIQYQTIFSIEITKNILN